MDIKQKLLDGVNVVEVSQLIAAPLCGLTLADLGASVTKVESPHGDYTRTWAKPGAESAIFHMLNRGKRSVVLDPRLPGHRVHAREMVMQADVVIENLGDAMAHTYGVDYADISDVRPKLIWCSISGLGRGRGLGQRWSTRLVSAGRQKCPRSRRRRCGPWRHPGSRSRRRPA